MSDTQRSRPEWCRQCGSFVEEGSCACLGTIPGMVWGCVLSILAVALALVWMAGRGN